NSRVDLFVELGCLEVARGPLAAAATLAVRPVGRREEECTVAALHRGAAGARGRVAHPDPPRVRPVRPAVVSSHEILLSVVGRARDPPPWSLAVAGGARR